jgi:hypothetical protein
MKDTASNSYGIGHGLQPPHGEPEQPVRSLANETEGSWLDRYYWEPGNRTRYDLIYGRRLVDVDLGPEEFVLIYVQTNRAMVFTDCYLHYSYIEEKLGVNEADAVGILGFLDRMGHAVGYPRPVAVPDTTPSTGGHHHDR